MLASRVGCLYTAGGPCGRFVPEEGNGRFNPLEGFVLKALEGGRHFTLQSMLAIV